MLEVQKENTRFIALHACQEAADLEIASEALARIGTRRGRLYPIAGTIDRALIEATTALAEARRLADREYVAAGGNPKISPYYPLRTMRPEAATRRAAAKAQQEQRAHELAALVERERRSAAYGRRGWAARQEGER